MHGQSHWPECCGYVPFHLCAEALAPSVQTNIQTSVRSLGRDNMIKLAIEVYHRYFFEFFNGYVTNCKFYFTF